MENILNQQLIFNQNYMLVKHLGGGLTADVFLALNVNNFNEKVALKIFKNDYLANG
jgi:serine/threonine protein kinase